MLARLAAALLFSASAHAAAPLASGVSCGNNSITWDGSAYTCTDTVVGTAATGGVNLSTVTTALAAKLDAAGGTMNGQLTNTSSITITGGSGAAYSMVTSSGINVQAGWLTVGYTINNYTIPSSSWNIVCACPVGNTVIGGGCFQPSVGTGNLMASYASTNTANGLWGITVPLIATTASNRSWACKWSAVSTVAQCQVTCARVN